MCWSLPRKVFIPLHQHFAESFVFKLSIGFFCAILEQFFYTKKNFNSLLCLCSMGGHIGTNCIVYLSVNCWSHYSRFALVTFWALTTPWLTLTLFFHLPNHLGVCLLLLLHFREQQQRITKFEGAFDLQRKFLVTHFLSPPKWRLCFFTSSVLVYLIRAMPSFQYVCPLIKAFFLKTGPTTPLLSCFDLPILYIQFPNLVLNSINRF